MKVLAIFLVAVVVSSQANEDILDKWAKFQADFGKTYRSPVEARARLNIFEKNLQKVEEHNALFEQGLVSYKKGINQFSDWTHEEFVAYLNKGLQTKPTIAGVPFEKSANFVAPASVDWRTKNVVTGVKDQGQCGSCWAFSTTGSLEGQLGLKGKLVSLSEQDLVDCSSDEGNAGCGGGLMTNGFDYIKANGIESEEDYPYTAEDGYCQHESSKVVTKVSSYVNIPSGDEDSLKEAIASKGPVSVAIDASDLSDYYGGIYDDPECSSDELDHGVLAVGYGSENGVNYYIVKNSWGGDWGESGYFRLIQKNNKCGIATMATYPVL